MKHTLWLLMVRAVCIVFYKLHAVKTGNCVTLAALFFPPLSLRLEWHLAFQLVPRAGLAVLFYSQLQSGSCSVLH